MPRNPPSAFPRAGRHVEQLPTGGVGHPGGIRARPASGVAVVRLAPQAVALEPTAECRQTHTQQHVSPEHLAAILSPNARERLLQNYAGFLSQVSFNPQVLVVHVEGWVSRSPVRARMVVTLVPIGQRLAVVRREVS